MSVEALEPETVVDEAADAAQQTETYTKEPFKAVVPRYGLEAALALTRHAGAQIDSSGHVANAYVSFIPLSERNRMLVRARGAGATITTSVAVNSVSGDSISVEGRRLRDLVKISAASDIDLKMERARLRMKTQTGKFRLEVLDDQIVPPEEEADEITLELAVSTFRDALRRCMHAMGKNDARAMLNGLCIETRGDELRVVGTDGCRLAIERIKIPNSAGMKDLKVVLARESVSALNSLLSGHEEELRIGMSERYLWASVPEEGDAPAADMVALVMDTSYPDYERVIPSLDAAPRLVGEAPEFRRAADIAYVVSENGKRFEKVPAFLTWDKKDGVVLTCGTDNQGRDQLDLECKTEAGDKPAQGVSVCVNPNYLMEAMQAIPQTGRMMMALDGQDLSQATKIVIVSEEAPSFKEVIMAYNP